MAQIIAHYRKVYSGSENLEFFYNDNLDSLRNMLNNSGSVQDTFVYGSWGNIATHTGSNNYLASFTGKNFDGTGLIYFNARCYDPTIGRFITEDPSKQGDSWFTYCSNNPINRIDIDGKDDVGFGGLYNIIKAYEKALEGSFTNKWTWTSCSLTSKEYWVKINKEKNIVQKLVEDAQYRLYANDLQSGSGLFENAATKKIYTDYATSRGMKFTKEEDYVNFIRQNAEEASNYRINALLSEGLLTPEEARLTQKYAAEARIGLLGPNTVAGGALNVLGGGVMGVVQIIVGGFVSAFGVDAGQKIIDRGKFNFLDGLSSGEYGKEQFRKDAIENPDHYYAKGGA